FLQRVGHDLRTPLTLVRMYTETLAEGRVDDAAEAREFAGIAAREAGRLARMVDGVLDLSRLERPEAAGRALDVAALAESVVEAHRPLAEEAGLVLSLERAGDGAADAVADADALRGAIGNLIENAIKHAPGGGAIDVRVEGDGASVRISVADRGPGFPPGGEDRMFERFVRGNDVRVPGTGLGLALVREVARRHGGDATARGRAGGGAEVELTLPRGTKETT
ncbi:MAG: sensor histidine kinase, partial [Planctomycetota bacterium JB042]